MDHGSLIILSLGVATLAWFLWLAYRDSQKR
jgi:hypothetical protein